MSTLFCMFLSYGIIAQSVAVIPPNCHQLNVTLRDRNDVHIFNVNEVYNLTKINGSILYLASSTIQLIISCNPIKILWINANNESIHSVSLAVDILHCITKTDEIGLIGEENTLQLLHNAPYTVSFNMNHILSDLLKYIENPTNDTNLIITCVLFALILLLICVCSCCLYSQCRNNDTRCCCCNCCDRAPAPAEHIANNKKISISINKTEDIERDKTSSNTNNAAPTICHKNDKIDAINSESIEQTNETKNDKESILEMERKPSVTSVDSVGSSLFGTQDGDDHDVTSPGGEEEDFSNVTSFKSDAAIKGGTSLSEIDYFDNDEKSMFLMETTSAAGSQSTVSSLGTENSWSEAYNKVETAGAGGEFTQNLRSPTAPGNFYNAPKKIISKNNRNAFRAKTQVTNPLSEVSEVSGRPFSSQFGSNASEKSHSSSGHIEFVEIQAIIGDVARNQQVQFMQEPPSHHQ